jgi:hypothetical protein
MSAGASKTIGANFDRVTDGTTTDGVNAEFALGTEIFADDGNVYRYVQAAAALSTTLNEPFALSITELGQASLATIANLLTDQNFFGVAPRQIIADNAFFWARMRGVFPIRVSASAAANALLGIGGVGATGRLASSVTASAGNFNVQGLHITAAASASASAGNTIRTAVATWPVVITAVAD